MAKESISEDIIEMTLSFKQKGILNRLRGIKFGDGSSTSQISALARPYLRLFETGKPIGTINHIFFKGNKWPTRILGSLAYSKAERILFFPGVSKRNFIAYYPHKKPIQKFNASNLFDHITLEKNHKKIHATILDSSGKKKEKLPRFNTKKITDNLIFWFGLTIKNIDILEKTPEEISLSFSSPPTDSNRRFKLLQEAHRDAIRHLIILSRFDNKINANEYLHFDFFIGTKDLDIEDKTIGCYAPYEKPIVNDYIEKESNHVRGHPVSLENFPLKVWIVVSKHIGKLSEDAFFKFY